MGSNTQPGRKDEFSPENIAESPAFEPPRPRRSRPARTAILAYVAIILALYACLRVFMLLNNESLPTKPAEEESSLQVIERMSMNLARQYPEQVLQPLGELERDLK